MTDINIVADIEIRPARADDRATLLGFLTQFQDYERALNPNLRLGAEVAESSLCEMERKTAAHDGAVFMAVLSGGAVGFVCCYAGHDDDMMLDEQSRPYGYVSDVFVASEHRGRGVGAALLDAAEAYLAGLGFHRVMLSVMAANADARAVYEKRGYHAYDVIYEKQFGGHRA